MAEISFACPSCNQTLEAPEDMAGQLVECPACRQQMTVPGEAAPAPAAEMDETVEVAAPPAPASQVAGAGAGGGLTQPCRNRRNRA